jgi:phosphate transport system permease protein
MTEIATSAPQAPAKGFDFSSAESAARVKRRYRAEARFRMMGASAVIIAGAFVMLLLADIILKGIPAFTEHRIVIPVELETSLIDPTGRRDPSELLGGDFAALARNALRALFPTVTDRASRRRLDNLLSTGAPDDIRAAVVRDPSLVGTTQNLPLLLTDDAEHFAMNLSRIGTESAVELITAPGISFEVFRSHIKIVSLANTYKLTKQSSVSDQRMFCDRRCGVMERGTAILSSKLPLAFCRSAGTTTLVPALSKIFKHPIARTCVLIFC